MTVIICLDDKNGIAFNGRRQSRDRVVSERIVDLSKGGKLFMNEYSAKIFQSDLKVVDNDFLTKAEAGDFCFCEDDSFLLYLGKITRLIVYRWNKAYPRDKVINADVFYGKTIKSRCDFVGNSHERITEEVYE
ncbi:MAG: ribonuclease Z [Clostridia bacterium]|nr:ribonuclease Z [Clostridia bacterium]